ncbi:uncharacterized protein BP5553_05779 [Venustampulla echinocandica]|uniref:Cell wall protein SED1 n=1 Tax=Venustampulla echinocandica TaxID=2656787 RepID=A0A370TLP9_9HELO|nr:uncharacterized protein BP5553_05779 [Venustampulla echinocandica]RDL36427.1 hypothetical protein BP5553_05779 [Venustampulla echinocandica]
MKTFQSLLPVFGLVSAVMGWSNETTAYTTVTVSSYTTYCPEATTITQGTKTYTATASETLTITDCPCTLTKPVKPTGYPTGVPPISLPSPINNATAPPPVWVTTTVSEYTTYCPAPTSVIQGNQTYTITEATTLTITNCPCTVSYPPSTTKTVTVSTLTTYCPAPTTITHSSSTYTVTTSGTATIPIVSVTTVPNSPPTPTVPAPGVTAAPPAPTAPGVVPTGSNPTVGKPPTPTASSSIIEANSASKADTGIFGLVVAGLAAMLI